MRTAITASNKQNDDGENVEGGGANNLVVKDMPMI